MVVIFMDDSKWVIEFDLYGFNHIDIYTKDIDNICLQIYNKNTIFMTIVFLTNVY